MAKVGERDQVGKVGERGEVTRWERWGREVKWKGGKDWLLVMVCIV